MAMVGKSLPDLNLPALIGGGIEPLKGSATGPTLVTLFASWCGPCAEEAPALMALKAEGVRIVGIAYKDPPADSVDFLRRYGDPYAKVLMDRDGRGGVELGVTGVPETLAVDRAGVIRGKLAGPLTAQAAESLLESAGR